MDLEAEIVGGEVALGGFGVELKDAFLEMRDIPMLGAFRVGHFFAPIGMEVLTSSNVVTFTERSLAHRLAPGREVGMAAYNQLPEPADQLGVRPVSGRSGRGDPQRRG